MTSGTPTPEIDEVGTSAANQLLSADTVRDLITRFDGEWRKKAQAWVTVGR